MESDLYREKICAKININIFSFAYFLDIFNIREKIANVRKKEYMQEKKLKAEKTAYSAVIYTFICISSDQIF